MGSTATSVLRTMRSPNVVNGLGLGFVGVIVLWLVVNFVKDPTYFLNVGLDGLTRGTVYGVVALGYTLVYGILQLINFAHGDVFALSGLVASTLMLSVLSVTPASSNAAVAGAVIVTLLDDDSTVRSGEREHRARRLPAVTQRATSRAADHRGRHVLHRPERVAGALRRRLRERLRAIPQGVAFHIGDVRFTWKLVIALAIIVPALAILTWFVESTRQGKAMRAVAQDTEASAMMGINVNRTISTTFVIAGSLAAVAGLVFFLEFQVRYDTGFELGLIAFTAAVLGGIGNLPGAVLGAL